MFRVIKKFKKVLSKKQQQKVLKLAILMIIGGFFESLSIGLVVPFITLAINNSAMKEIMTHPVVAELCGFVGIESANTLLVVLAIFLAVVFIIKNLFLLFQYYMQYRFVYNNQFSLQKKIFGKIVRRPYEYYLGVSTGEILRVVGSDIPNSFSLLATVLTVISEIVIDVILATTVFLLSPQITIGIVVAMAVVIGFINYAVKPVLRRAGQVNQRSQAGMSKWMIQAINGIKELKVMQKEEHFVDQYSKHGSEFVVASRKYSVLNIAPRFIIEGTSIAAVFFVLAILLGFGGSINSYIPLLAAVAAAGIRLLPSANRISSGLASVSYYEPMLDNLIQYLESDSVDETLKAGNNGKADSKKLPRLEKEITFSNISYHYPSAEEWILKNATMIIRRGQSVGICGPSGAGKTTAIDIIMGLLEPQEGEILVDGVNIKEDLAGWYPQIGYIPQTIFLMDASIRDNITFAEAEEDISEEKLWKALEKAALADFVSKLPDGVDTQIGERGIRLSGGQKQRIGIARALYREPEILIFDEATSALDNETEKEIVESIQRLQGQKTMIIIAHRLTTIEGCDCVYHVENQKIRMDRSNAENSRQKNGKEED